MSRYTTLVFCTLPSDVPLREEVENLVGVSLSRGIGPHVLFRDSGNVLALGLFAMQWDSTFKGVSNLLELGQRLIHGSIHHVFVSRDISLSERLPDPPIESMV